MATQLFKFDFNKKPQSTEESTNAPNITDLSSANSDKIEMDDAVFKNFRDFIYKLCGIYFTDGKKYLLEGRIVRRLVAHKLQSFDEYLKFITSPDGKSELNALLEAITISETYFFRAPKQFDAMENTIIPEIIASKSNNTSPVVKIWVAASSTGEEAYTIAIIILERLRHKYPHVQFQIYASDINNAVIENAKKGIYKNYAVRSVPKDILEKYFKFDGRSYILSDSVKKMVHFSNINLYNAEQMREMRGMDIVFCCNVLIYFDTQAKRQVVSYLYDSLNKGGYLFVGYSESLHGLSETFKLVHLHKAMAYRRE